VVTWITPVIAPGDEWMTTVLLCTDTATLEGTPLQHTILVEPAQPDTTPGDNTVIISDAVEAPFDPNFKEVEPTVLSPQELSDGERVTYTIHFQNTGSAPATRVLLTDTLSADLEWGSIEFVSSSHLCSWYVDAGVLIVIFDDIQLPDSTTDEPGSHGFARFSVQPDPGLLPGEVVPNMAGIYFDFNPAVITEACFFEIDQGTGMIPATRTGVRVYPDPTSGPLHYEIDAEVLAYRVLNAEGRVVRSGRATDRVGTIDVSALTTGAHVLELITDQGAARMLFIKE
jgi:uncharacterized repeat protein (TIGR01451 family)